MSTEMPASTGTSRPPMVGWIVFAAMLLIVLGSVAAIEGLIAIIRGVYYVPHGDQLIVFDTKTWGWVTLLEGILLALIGLALWAGAGWARWTAIFLVTVNLLSQLGWLGNTAYPLWALVVVTLDVVVIYALTVRWAGYPEMVRAAR